MPARTTNLYLLADLVDAGRTSELAESDLEALQAVADWIKTFVVKPHKDLGRPGTVCPFVPGSLERKVLWRLFALGWGAGLSCGSSRVHHAGQGSRHRHGCLRAATTRRPLRERRYRSG